MKGGATKRFVPVISFNSFSCSDVSKVSRATKAQMLVGTALGHDGDSLLRIPSHLGMRGRELEFRGNFGNDRVQTCTRAELLCLRSRVNEDKICLQISSVVVDQTNKPFRGWLA